MAGYRSQAEDTPPDIDRMVFARLREMTPAQRLQIAADATRAVHELSLAGLRLRHPHADDEELHMRAAALRNGRDCMLRFFGESALAWFP